MLGNETGPVVFLSFCSSGACRFGCFAFRRHPVFTRLQMMAEGNSQGIGGVVLLGFILDLKDGLQHARNLFLGGVAVSGDRLFYFFRGIFRYR